MPIAPFSTLSVEVNSPGGFMEENSSATIFGSLKVMVVHILATDPESQPHIEECRIFLAARIRLMAQSGHFSLFLSLGRDCQSTAQWKSLLQSGFCLPPSLRSLRGALTP